MNKKERKVKYQSPRVKWKAFEIAFIEKKKIFKLMKKTSTKKKEKLNIPRVKMKLLHDTAVSKKKKKYFKIKLKKT